MNQEVLRIVDAIAKERNIDREEVFSDLESAMIVAARKKYGPSKPISVHIDRKTGDITATVGNEPISLKELGRIAAQTAKQVMTQKIKEAERNSLLEEFMERKRKIVTGTVSRVEPSGVIINLGKAEGFLPAGEQIPGENYQPGQRVRALVIDVKESSARGGGSGVKIILSRTAKDFIKRLFEIEVPEVADGTIEIKALAREAGYRTKVAVISNDPKVDAIGACVGIKGTRIKSIVEELNGEKIDVVRWSDSSTMLISNALKPADAQHIALCFELGKATVVVDEDQLSLAIGKRGQNVRLAARLTGWDIDIITPAEYNASIERLEKVVASTNIQDPALLSKLVALGIVNVADLAAVGPDPLIGDLNMSPEEAELLVQKAREEAEKVREELDEAQAEAEKLAEEEALGQSRQNIRARFFASSRDELIELEGKEDNQDYKEELNSDLEEDLGKKDTEGEK